MNFAIYPPNFGDRKFIAARCPRQNPVADTT
jgi:hypothetical protein